MSTVIAQQPSAEKEVTTGRSITHPIVIVLADHGQRWSSVAQTIRRTAISMQGYRDEDVTVITSDMTAASNITANTVIALGSHTVEAALRIQSDHVWSAVVTSEFAYRSAATFPQVECFWVIDQPLRRQLALIHHVLPKATRVGILLNSRRLSEPFVNFEADSTLPLSLRLIPVDKSSETINVLNRNLADIDALLTVPDRTTINRHTARGILLATYARRIPVFAYSSSYVRAGALASLFSPMDQIGRTIGQALSSSPAPHTPADNSSSPCIRHPSGYDVATNPRVARSLDIPLKTERSILKSLERTNVARHRR